MSQNDLNIANQTASTTRADINSALQALGSNNSGSSAPTTTYANMHWYDTSSNMLKQRSEADDAWISIGYFDQSTNAFKVLDDTMVVNTSGTQTGLIGDQSTATWQAGTGNTESLISPTKLNSAIETAIETYFGANAIGVNQTWQDFTGSGRSNNTAYQNTTGRPIMVAIMSNWNGSQNQPLQVSSNGTTYIGLDGIIAGGDFTHVSAIIPDQHYYKLVGSFSTWAELR